MKFLRSYLMFLLLMLVNGTFSACKKETDLTPQLIGKWKQQAIQYRIIYEVNGIKYDKTGTRSMQDFEIEFGSDGMVSMPGEIYSYSVSGDQMTLRRGTITSVNKINLHNDQLTLTRTKNVMEGLSEAVKLRDAKAWAGIINYPNGGNGVYTYINIATKGEAVYMSNIYERVK